MADFGKKETLVQKFLQALKPLEEMTGVPVEGQTTNSVAKLSETFAVGCEQVSATLKETAGSIREVGRVLEEMLQNEKQENGGCKLLEVKLSQKALREGQDKRKQKNQKRRQLRVIVAHKTTT